MSNLAFTVIKMGINAIGGAAVTGLAETGFNMLVRKAPRSVYRNRYVRKATVKAASMTVGMITSACINNSIDELYDEVQAVKSCAESIKRDADAIIKEKQKKKEEEKALEDPKVKED